MEKDIVYIGLEFLFGPIQKFEENEKGEQITGIKLIDDDEYVKSLDSKINDLWCSLWSNDECSTSGMKFDKKREAEMAPELLELINRLIARLNEISDGSYEIEDMITGYLKSLI